MVLLLSRELFGQYSVVLHLLISNLKRNLTRAGEVCSYCGLNLKLPHWVTVQASDVHCSGFPITGWWMCFHAINQHKAQLLSHSSQILRKFFLTVQVIKSLLERIWRSWVVGSEILRNVMVMQKLMGKK